MNNETKVHSALHVLQSVFPDLEVERMVDIDTSTIERRYDEYISIVRSNTQSCLFSLVKSLRLEERFESAESNFEKKLDIYNQSFEHRVAEPYEPTEKSKNAQGRYSRQLEEYGNWMANDEAKRLRLIECDDQRWKLRKAILHPTLFSEILEPETVESITRTVTTQKKHIEQFLEQAEKGEPIESICSTLGDNCSIADSIRANLREKEAPTKKSAPRQPEKVDENMYVVRAKTKREGGVRMAICDSKGVLEQEFRIPFFGNFLAKSPTAEELALEREKIQQQIAAFALQLEKPMTIMDVLGDAEKAGIGTIQFVKQAFTKRNQVAAMLMMALEEFAKVKAHNETLQAKVNVARLVISKELETTLYPEQKLQDLNENSKPFLASEERINLQIMTPTKEEERSIEDCVRRASEICDMDTFDILDERIQILKNYAGNFEIVSALIDQRVLQKEAQGKRMWHEQLAPKILIPDTSFRMNVYLLSAEALLQEAPQANTVMLEFITLVAAKEAAKQVLELASLYSTTDQ